MTRQFYCITIAATVKLNGNKTRILFLIKLATVYLSDAAPRNMNRKCLF